MKAYIFDLDGTLLDSMAVWEQIDFDFLSKRGREVPPDYIDTICSLSFPEAAAYTIKRFNLAESVEELLCEWNEMAVDAYGNTVELKPSARAYLLALKKCKVKLGIATSLPAKLYEPVLQHHHIRELFDIICSTDEVVNGKTHPDIFYLAANKLGISPAECMMFEDNLQAVRSAKTAGMVVYGVYDESAKEQWAEITEIADGIVYDFKDAPLPK